MSDNLYVNRNNTTYQVDMENLRSIEDTDLLLVNRNGTTYTVTGDKVGGGGGDLTQVNLAPLSGTPEFEVTATTDLSNILPESTIDYQWYRYTASTGGTGTLLQSLNSDSAILDTYTTTAADQGNYIGCTVTYLGTTVTETARTQCLVAPGPVATMHGLRFDPVRTTTLSRSLSLGNSANTISFWIKPTKNDFTYVLAMDNGGNQYIGFDATRLLYSAGGTSANTTYSLQLNEWQNVVMSNDTTTTTFYVNGVSVGSAASAAITGADLNISFSSSGLNGYLSELYFVDGQALPPEVFGKNFEPYGWGPLDSSQIEENINNAPKFPPGANTSQVWSAGTTSGDPFSPLVTSIFDGSFITAAAGSQQGSTFTLTNQPVAATNIRVYGGSAANNWNFTVSGTNITVVSHTATPAAGEKQWSGPTPAGGNAFTNYVDLGPGTLENFQATSDSGAVAAIEIDGRLLVDSTVWNNSQNWSETLTYSQTGDGYVVDKYKGFDGDITQRSYTQGSSASQRSLTIDLTGKGLSGAVRIYTFVNRLNAGPTLQLNGGSAVDSYNFNSGNTGGYNWVELGNDGAVETIVITMNSSSDSAYVGAIEVDGAILVDSGAQWNTSQIWSANTTGSWDSSRPASNAFDGDPSSFGRNAGGQMAAVSFPTISGVTSLILSGAVDSTNGTIEVETTPGVFVDVSSEFTASSGNLNTATLPASITSISGIRLNNNLTSGNPKIAYIKANGEVLVNKASFGANGFYLPFDPSNTGANYSSNVSGSGAVSSSVNAFDGSNSNRWSVSCDSTSNFLSVTFNPPLVGQLSVLEYSSNQSTFQYAVNGSDVGSPHTGFNGLTETDLGTYGSITEFKYKVASTSSAQQGGFTGLKLNGVLLTDHSSIGVDASGNENNFYDQNFGIGNASQVWSSTISDTPYLTFVAANAFNGVLDSSSDGWSIDPNTTATWNPGIAGQTLVIYAEIVGNPTLKVNGNAVTLTAGSYVNLEIDLGNDGFQSFLYTRDSANDYLYMWGFSVDGEILVDTNQQDTVTDTPLKIYAVLESGANGNLVATGVSSITYLGEAGTDYYYEEDGVGAVHTGGATFASVSGKVYNFGQQPFASQYDDSQVWSGSLTSSDGTYSSGQGPTKAFNGVAGGGIDMCQANNPGANLTWTFSGLSGSVRVWIGNDGAEVTDGNGTVRGTNVGNGDTFVTLTGDISEYNGSIVITTSSDAPSLGAVELGGKILVDTGNPLSAAQVNTLFQTWEESKVVVFRAQIAAADVIMAALTQHAQTYDPAEDYCEGSVIKAFGELWIAVNQAPATTFADLPALMTHPNWDRLGITV